MLRCFTAILCKVTLFYVEMPQIYSEYRRFIEKYYTMSGKKLIP